MVKSFRSMASWSAVMLYISLIFLFPLIKTTSAEVDEKPHGPGMYLTHYFFFFQNSIDL